MKSTPPSVPPWFDGSPLGLRQLAERIAREAHAGQFRRDGVTPYIMHPAEVARRVSGEDDELVAVAWLHDVFEDTPVTPNVLRQSGIPERVVQAVGLLTKRRRENYLAYLHRVADDPLARRVKVADILNNLSDSPTDRQIRKYAQALLILQSEQVGPPDPRAGDAKVRPEFTDRGDHPIQMLLKLGFDDPTRGLLARLTPEADDLTIAYVMRLLLTLRATSAIPQLIRMLADGVDERIRDWAAGVLGEMGATAAVPSLAKLAKEGDHDETSLQAVRALGAIGSAEARAELAALSVYGGPDENHQSRASLAAALLEGHGGVRSEKGARPGR